MGQTCFGWSLAVGYRSQSCIRGQYYVKDKRPIRKKLLPTRFAPATVETTVVLASVLASHRTRRARTGFVDRQAATLELSLVEIANRFLCIVLVHHFDEREPAWTPCRSVGNDVH